MTDMVDRGPTWGLLRYLRPMDRHVAAIRSLPVPQIKFNYRGTLETPPAPLIYGASIPVGGGGVLHADNLRAYLLNVEIVITEGQLAVLWKYSVNVHRPSTIEHLVDSFQGHVAAMLDHVRKSHSQEEPCE